MEVKNDISQVPPVKKENRFNIYFCLPPIFPLEYTSDLSDRINEVN